MKFINKLFAVLLVITMAFVFPFAAFAEDNNFSGRDRAEQVKQNKSVNKAENNPIEKQKELLEEEKEDLEDQLKEAEENGDLELVALLEAQIEDIEDQIEDLAEQEEELKPWEIAKNLIEQEKDAIEALKDQIEEQIEDLEREYEAAEESGDTDLMNGLKSQIETLQAEKDALKQQMKQKIEQMQQVMREKYTVDELSQLALVSQEFSKRANVRVIPVENVFFNNGNVKFDTPPVVKEGRTLLPLRAISEATGATVHWDPVEKIVTITKGEQIIIFSLADNKIYINNVETTIDVSAEVMNNRTMVPLRFIVENLGLEVEWNSETQTIEID